MSLPDEFCSIEIGSDQVQIATRYEVTLGVFEQPSSFALQLGSSQLAASIISKYPPHTPFRLKMAGQPQFTGYTDGIEATGDATEIAIHGRDILAQLRDSFHEKEASYVSQTHRDLIQKALEEVELVVPFSTGLGRRPLILASNTESRSLRSGATIVAQGDEFSTELDETVGSRGNAVVVLRAKLGERWIDLLQRHLRQHGLFIWASATGDIIVGRPNAHQPAIARIFRPAETSRSNVKSAHYKNDFTPRYSEVVIYGRTTGRKYSKRTTKGAYTDDELLNLGIRKVLVLRDMEVTSVEHAEMIARRHLAEGRRAGFFLEYTMSGHTTQSLLSPKRVVWTPDTVVAVEDERLGIRDNLWVERVTHRRDASGGTTTTVRLLPPDALIFGEDV